MFNNTHATETIGVLCKLDHREGDDDEEDKKDNKYESSEVVCGSNRTG